ncbi:metallophosphoesterase [Hymenobacter sp. BT770]|uniref:metallophosphoesterase n=1 Tax=Hymenobacter sp. BT770 TaxID=2886942 RepID=UPI001D111F15|nr:metallophosphoesterase [Hymenobacter sp. BT770]MCC3153283.1 metallophosphoesterase [Hymenobacter sp. BT770]MDO3414278.1 metallophosphoesterase [Hymenobacter sp. BT770]
MPLLFRFRPALLTLCAVLAFPFSSLAQGESSENPVNSRPNYRRGGLDWKSKVPPDSAHIRYTVFLIGDVGKPASKGNGGEPSLNFLRKKIMEAGAKSTTIFLGDNVYEFGMPEEGAYDRKVSEERLRDQIDVLRNYKGEKYMIPGNHDWKQGLKGGLEQVLREQRFAENYMASDSAAFAYTGDFITPANGCPGPYEIRLQDDLVLITINSQWFLTNRNERPYGADGGCGVEDETDFMAQLEDIIARNKDKNIMVVGHHPLFSDGVHGGYFTLGDHIFPISIVYKYAFLPLPIIGSIYPFARKYGGVSQDVAYPAYQAYKKGLMDIFDKYPNIIYAAGHEHNLQYFKEGTTHCIVSGSGCKTQHVKPGDGGSALFSDKEKGWARVNYYDDGQVWTEYFVPEGKGDKARLVFRTPLYAKTTLDVATTEAAPVTPVEKQRRKEKGSVTVPALPTTRPNFRDSSVVVAVNPRYNKHGKLHNWLLGEHYRKEWATPVKFPLLDLAHDKGGLVPYKTGGGKQTASLKVRNEEGHNFTLRGIDKDPAAVLPEALRTGFAKDILQDQISAQHPYASFVLPPLGTAAGILHTNPVPVYIPQDPLLGQYYSAFSNQPAALEEDAKDDQSNVASLGNAKNLVGTDKMLERLLEDNDNKIDQVAFARSRLFDMWIGDWDRHEDQWRWAEVKDKDGNRTFTAVPEDRDIAFFKGDGVLPFLVSRKFAIRNFQNFGYDYADYKGLNQTALSNDRTFLSGVTREQWVAQAQYMKEHLTDEVIEKAFREKWPQEIYALHGAEIVAKLKSRRDLLPDLASKYANVVAKIVEVRGTEKNEKFVVDRLPNGDTHLTVRKITKEGKVTKVLYDRVLEHGVTDEVRLYGIRGKDVYEVKGDVKKAIKLRLIGGTDRDTITDVSRVAGFQHYTQVYDADTGNVINVGKEARLRLEPGVDVSRYDHPKRFDLKDYRLNYTGPNLFFGYNIDDGILLGGGITHRRYGFRREPFSSEQSIAANFAPARDAFNLKYTGQFTRLIGKYDLHIASQYYGPQLLYNFFGIGNNTANLATEDANRGVVTARTVNSAYRVRFTKFNVAPTLERNLFSFLKLGVGPQYEQFRVEQDPIGTIIKDSLTAKDGGVTYENRRFGIRASDFQTNQYLGGLLYLNLDASSSPKNPRIGIRWYNEAQYNFQLNGEQLQFGRLTSEIRAYLTPNLPFQITYAGRLGATRNIGDYRFYQANTLGGTTNLRGYRRTRYAGRSSLYANFEARLQLLSFNAYLFPGKLGVLGLADFGRVYSDYDKTNGISAFHSGFGGGVYVDVLKQAVINATYSVGEEKLVFVGFDFLF